jgi:hypothetical protein
MGAILRNPIQNVVRILEHGTLAWIIQSKRYVDGGGLPELAGRSL